MQKTRATFIFAFILSTIFIANFSFGQITNRDYTGFIQKYDTTFNGIGPEVYFVPAPRSKSETLMDEYTEISNFTDSINQVSNYHKLITSFKNTSNYNTISRVIDNNSTTLEIQSKIAEAQLHNYPIAVGLLNELAKQAITSKEYTQAEQYLKQALEISNTGHEIESRDILLSNLYYLYLYSQQPLKAKVIEELSYQEAKKNKSLPNQANSLVKLARIQAAQLKFKEAEHTIIWQAIPLFNRTKNYKGKISAWVSLAEIYTQNKQYPEAQWFLIQAKELSKSKKISSFNLDIEYLLGYSKFHQNNLVISKKELSSALDLARENGDKLKELSATQMLGEISIKQNMVEEAEGLLKSYWELRKQLF